MTKPRTSMRPEEDIVGIILGWIILAVIAAAVLWWIAALAAAPPDTTADGYDSYYGDDYDSYPHHLEP